MHIVRPHAQQQAELPQHHQPLDVMRVAMLDRVADGLVQAAHIGLAGPEEAWHRQIGVECISLGVIRH